MPFQTSTSNKQVIIPLWKNMFLQKKETNSSKYLKQPMATSMLLVSQKTQTKMKKTYFDFIVTFSFYHNHWTLEPQHMKCWALNLLKQNNFVVNRWTTSILPRFHKKTQTKRKRLTSTLLLAFLFPTMIQHQNHNIWNDSINLLKQCNFAIH